jgi:hypothetical protein
MVRMEESNGQRTRRVQLAVNALRFSHYVFTVCIALASLAACAAPQPPIDALNGANNVVEAASHHRIFHYKGKKQSFIVPTGVTHVTVVATGASGPDGLGSGSCSYSGGTGGVLQATIPVTPGETLAIFVGGEGGIGATCGSKSGSGSGGFNGGGNGGASYTGGFDVGDGGGGASDVREGGSGFSNRVIIAGGGGGAGGGAFNHQGYGGGGDGGGRIGGRGSSGNCGSGWGVGGGGSGGTQTRGGKGGLGGCDGYGHGVHGDHGAFGLGGSGGSGDSPDGGGGGGGGGGGYYGGGGGGSGETSTSSTGSGGGGGGGSSYVESGATDVKDKKGAASPGNGQIKIFW